MSPPIATSTTAHTATGGALGFAPGAELSPPSWLPRLLEQGNWLRLRAFTDITLLCLAATAALVGAPGAHTAPYRIVAALFPLLAFGMLRLRPGPDELVSASLLETFGHVMSVLSLAAMVTIAANTFAATAHPGWLGLRLWLFGTVYVGGGRLLLLSFRRQATRTATLATPTLIVGAGTVGEHLAQRLATDPRYGLRPVGFVDANPLPCSTLEGSSLPVYGGLEDLPRALDLSGARRVIAAFSTEPDHVLARHLRLCHERGVEVSLVPRLYESINERATLDRIGGLPLVTLRPTDPYGWQFALKHTMDRGISLIALVALAPLLGAIALAVRLSSPGPVLFRQRRIGRDGHEFELLKFRTMRMEGDGDHEFQPRAGSAPGGIEGRDRRTRIGVYLRELSLDELPQLINVLRGDMSLVGPRPERPEFVQRFTTEVNRYSDRHRVKSGITGWAQVNGLRGQTSIADRVEWDNWYIQNWSLRLDLRIVALTLAEVLRFRE